MSFHVMLIPTLGCPSNCSYCWSSEEDSPVMSIETIEEVVKWLKNFRTEPVTFTFHGGEPLLAGPDFYRKALALLAEGLAHQKIAFALQTNLWKMTPELAQILAEYNIPIGSSLDGPKELNDLQRGDGYFEKTMKGYEIARENGLKVSFICTFTSNSVKSKEDIFNLDTVSSLKSKTPPIVLQLTCLTGLFSHPSETSLTEEMLSHPDGPVLTVAATSLTLSGHQEPFAIELLQQMQDSNIIRIGDAFQEAKLSLEIDNANGLREIGDTFTLFAVPCTTMDHY